MKLISIGIRPQELKCTNFTEITLANTQENLHLPLYIYLNETIYKAPPKVSPDVFTNIIKIYNLHLFIELNVFSTTAKI